MRLIRAAVFGVLLWLLIFFEVSSLLFGFGIGDGSDLYFLTHFVFLVLFILVCTLGYFWVPRMRGGLVHGLLVGVIFIIVMVLLDLFITINFFVKDFGFFSRGDVIVGQLLVLLLCGLIGWTKK